MTWAAASRGTCGGLVCEPWVAAAASRAHVTSALYPHTSISTILHTYTSTIPHQRELQGAPLAYELTSPCQPVSLTLSTCVLSPPGESKLIAST